MNKSDLDILVNIIGAVESGGQVYGNRKYDAYTEPAVNTANEVTITIGWAQNYGYSAMGLMKMIYQYDVEYFRSVDDTGIEAMLDKDWVALKWKPSEAQKQTIIKLISSEVGKRAQDELFARQMAEMVADCEDDYTSDIAAQMMYCEIRHLGGKYASDRIFMRLNGDYSLDAILASLKLDQTDTRYQYPVGSELFWSRHEKCVEFIKKYVLKENDMTAKDITLCGHGSGTPALHNMYDYCASRYNAIAPNGKHKGVIVVRRLKSLNTDALRRAFVDTYATILGRNVYSQDLRDYVYTPYKGKYYSDCSSSICATFAKIGLYCPLYNTAGIYNSSLFETVPVNIVNGQITNPEVLRLGDCLEFVGNDPARPLQIGHVEAVYAIAGEIVKPAEPAPTPVKTNNVSAFQKFLNSNYGSIIKTCTGDNQLAVDGSYGPKTRAAALGVWKYMANKYYGSNLTIGNSNFYESCYAVAKKMTLGELGKHATLAYILQGVLSGKGYYDGAFDGSIGSQSKAAIKAMTGSIAVNADMWSKLFN